MEGIQLVKDYKGREYKDIKQMCSSYGIREWDYYTRHILGRWRLEETLETTQEVKVKEYYDHKGNVYKFITTMCETYGIAVNTFRRRLLANWDLERALTEDRKEIQIESIDHKGNKFKNKTEMCKAYGKTLNRVKSSLARGHSLQEALEFGRYQRKDNETDANKSEISLAKRADDRASKMYSTINKLKVTGINIEVDVCGDITNVGNSVSTIIIPEGINTLKYSQGKDYNTSVKKIVTPSTLRIIEANSLSCFRGVETLELKEGLNFIGVGAFRGLEKLKHIEFPDSLEVIEPFAFKQTGLVGQIKLPKKLARLGEGAFCLTEVESIDFNNCEIEALEEIGSDNISIKHLYNLPSKLKAIDFRLLKHLKSLEELVLEQDDLYLAPRALNEMYVKVLDMKKCKIDKIEDNINKCRNLEKIVFPDTLQEIEGNCFENCPELEELDLSNTSIQRFTIDGRVVTNIKNVILSKKIEKTDLGRRIEQEIKMVLGEVSIKYGVESHG